LSPLRKLNGPGWYIHVDLIDAANGRFSLAIGKTFGGLTAAYAIAQACAEALDA